MVLVLGARYSAGSLDWPMMLLLLDAVAVGLISGPIYGVVVAILSAVGILYFIAYPADTWNISSANDLISLIVFVTVGIGAVILAALVTQARASEARATSRARLLATVLDVETTPDVAAALERIRREFTLNRVVLLGPLAGGKRVEIATSTGERVPSEDPSVEAELPEGHKIVGYGQELLGERRTFFDELASAAYRAYDSQRLAEEQERSRLLAAADSARAAVLAAVGHDLRTPLSGLRVALDGLRSDDHVLTAEENDELLDTAERSTRRLDELISNLIDLSRLQAGVLPVTLEAADLGAVVAQARLDVGRQNVEVHVPDSMPFIVTDPVLLERIVGNLLSNGVRHSPEGAPVDVTTTVVGDEVFVTVADHGPGLDAARRKAMLADPLPSTRRADGGSGLGLAIVRQLTSALGGRLIVDETAGGGLTVHVALPLNEPDGSL